MDSLLKYVPFVDFLLKTDEAKYYKFTKIKKWILSKKRYSSTFVKTTEAAVLTQYKNLLLENKVKIPENITATFTPSIDLCSDDEEHSDKNKKTDSGHNVSKEKQKRNRLTNIGDGYLTLNLSKDEGDDLEFISIDYAKEAEKKGEKQPGCKTDDDIDRVSRDILKKIDEIAGADIKLKGLEHEPNNYTYEMKNEVLESVENGDENIFQRRPTNADILFKRRVDFRTDEVVVECLNGKNQSLLSSEKQIETISLDSDSENEICKNDEQPSTSRARSEFENTDSNSNSTKGSSKLELLYNSIDSVLPEMSDILNEVEDVNNANSNEQTEKTVVVEDNEKENIVEKNTPGTQNLDPAQISKILEDISSKTDFEMETFYEALQYIKQMNSTPTEVPEAAPPAPPPIPANATIASSSPAPIEQQWPQVSHSLAAPNVNFVPTPPLPRPKLNINDPRIKKQLQVIKNSPLFSNNLLKNDLEESIRKICHETVMQPSILNLNKINTGPAVAKTPTPSVNKSTITYGEYKRRQLEKKLEMERKREEERKAKTKEQQVREEREKSEQNKKREKQNIRSQILSTLDPCKEALYSLWKQQTHCKENQQNKEVNTVYELDINSAGDTPNQVQKENIQTKQSSTAKQLNSNASTRQSKKNSDHKLNRIFNELRCTVKGFDQIQDFVVNETNTVSNELQTDGNSSSPTEETPATRLIGLRRRSSMHALSAITEQLCSESDCWDSETSESTSRKRSRKWSSSEDTSQDSFHLQPKRKKSIDEAIRPRQPTRALVITDDEKSSSDSEHKMRETLKERFFTKWPVIKLHRISNDFIRKHTKRPKQDSENAHKDVKLKKTCEVVENLREPGQKKLKLKKYNNDCRMTGRNTPFCVLCRSKPWDLTNHYKGRHKTESYISRLDWSELEDLCINTRFATLLPATKNYRFERYEVECAFCKQKITDQFINLYNHYSLHTGEYAFQCAHCFFAKPYKPDIQSHILHSKTCRNSSIQVVYRYPPQARCIYLHYCVICNFVQLNEANVLKHLREHHDPSKAVESNVRKCIVAAISDGADTVLASDADNTADSSTNLQSPTSQEASTEPQIKFKVDDDDIPVSNEPCFEEDDLDSDQLVVGNVFSSRYIQLDYGMQPMTVIHHNFETNSQQNTNQTITSLPGPQPAALRVHQPIHVKNESPQINQEKAKPTSSTCSQQKPPADRSINTVYEKYRSYPPNANYLGLFKCMIDDCFYSTDCISDIITHLTEHSAHAPDPNQYLQCPYCIFTSDVRITPTQLADHVRTQHGHLKFQCSVCCYRSCDASNVHFHQQMHHRPVLSACKIYKSPTDDSNLNSKENLNLNEQIERNIFKICCKICNSVGFYHTQLLINHVRSVHNLSSDNNSLNIYSCLNCPFTVDNKNQLRLHIAKNHPDQRPLIYDHNTQINNTSEDTKSSSNVVDISEPVPYIEVCTTTTSDTCSEEGVSQDIKPDFNELVLMNEETARVRLRKLTAHTGVAPDNLYRCPEQTCGGFFSNAELWLKHMKNRHLSLECQCPHCSTALVLPLEEIATHLEQHRRHTYFCFYCSVTSPTEAIARKHAAQKHTEFRMLRFEKISLNISYSYWIMIQRELFEEREKFITELLMVLEERLNELERNEIKNLKQQWPIQYNTAWLDEYLLNLPKRKVARRCLIKDCSYRTLREDNLYRHLSTSHTIAGTQFNCSKCEYHLDRCNDLDELFNHIKLHNEDHFICSACSSVTSSRSKVTTHIEEQHSARDVPVIHLFRTSDHRYHRIHIVFADNNITFSSMKNCFCCSEKNMSGDVFTLHLKRYHNFSLTYYCEKCTNFAFKSLQEVKPHFEQFHHNLGKFKIRCELATRSDLLVVSLNEFRVEVLPSSNPVTQRAFSSTATIKDEPFDVSDNDNVVLIEDDDIAIENSLKEAQSKQKEIPKIKCASFSKLLDSDVDAVNSTQDQLPRLKCIDFSKMISPNSSMPAPAPPPLEALAVRPLMQAHPPGAPQVHAVRPLVQTHPPAAPQAHAHAVRPSMQTHPPAAPQAHPHAVRPSMQTHPPAAPQAYAHAVRPLMQTHPPEVPQAHAHAVPPSMQTHPATVLQPTHVAHPPMQTHGATILQQTHVARPPMPNYSIPSAPSTQSYYNSGQQTNANLMMNNFTTLNQLPPVPPLYDCEYNYVNKTTNNTVTQIESALNVSNQNILYNNYPNHQYIESQTANNNHMLPTSNVQISNSTNLPYLISSQNYNYNNFHDVGSRNNNY